MSFVGVAALKGQGQPFVFKSVLTFLDRPSCAGALVTLPLRCSAALTPISPRRAVSMHRLPHTYASP